MMGLQRGLSIYSCDGSATGDLPFTFTRSEFLIEALRMRQYCFYVMGELRVVEYLLLLL
jgi:hypothetical protein